MLVWHIDENATVLVIEVVIEFGNWYVGNDWFICPSA